MASRNVGSLIAASLLVMFIGTSCADDWGTWQDGMFPDLYYLRDAFVRKHDPDGDMVWTRQLETSARALDVTVDESGNILLAGETIWSL